jgi:hypothetical protein
MFTLLQVNGTGILPPITVEGLLGDFSVLLVLSACIVGIAWRTLGKYWDKWRDGEVISFDKVFAGTAVAAFVAAITPALALFPAASATFATALGNYGMILAWIITAFSAYGINESINYTYRRVEQKAEQRALSSIDRKIEERVKAVLEEKNSSTTSSVTSGTEGRHEV